MPSDEHGRAAVSRRRRRNDQLRDNLDRLIGRNEGILIALMIAAIAYGDWLAGPNLSIGFLYLIPLSLCALTKSWQITAALVVPCVVLRQFLGPVELSPAVFFFRDLALTAVFLALVSTMSRLSRRRRDFFESARRQRDELLDEIRLAAEVQENIIQRNAPPPTRFDIVARMESARVVGGDYYDFLKRDDDTLDIVIADVAGKGLSAAMLMPAVDIALQTLIERTSSPSELLEALNESLFENTGAANYATLLYCSLTLSTGAMRYANGGHLPGLVFRSGSDEVERLSEGGTPVGLLPGAVFNTGRTQLAAGDILLLCSDGILEETNAAGEQFGEERLTEVVKQVQFGDSLAIVNAVIRAVRTFRASDSPSDDSTLIAVKAPPASPA